MKRVVKKTIALALWLVLSNPLWGELQMERVAVLPDNLPDWLEPLLVEEGFRVNKDGAVMADFWFRGELPEKDPTGELGIEFSMLTEGVLVGLVHLVTPWKDYRDQPIPAGVYTLRYGIQPADGDHTGQTWFRDYLMLLPLDKDIFVADSAEAESLVEASKLVSGTAHPAVAALFQVYDGIEEPGIVPNDLDQPMLGVILGPLTLGVVVEGRGPELTL